MIVQVIEGRYTVDHGILKSYLERLFKDGNFEIVLPDEGEKWKVQVPRELTRDELVEIQRQFRQAI